MYDLLRLTIQSKNFKISEIQYRVKRLYATGDLTDEQLIELFSMIAENASPEVERPETLALIQTLSSKLEALTARVKALETGGGTDEGGATEYPAWVPWDGLSNNYQCGAVVSHNNQLWQSTFSGQNVWEPGTVDERFWVIYTPEA